MMARLGNVIYWIACGLAVLVFLYFLRAFGFDDGSTQDKVLAFIAAGIVALIVWAIG